MSEETIEMQYNDKPKQLAEQLIKMLRKQQKGFIEGEETHSGLDVANNMVQQGQMSPALLISSRKAIINYDTPFEII